MRSGTSKPHATTPPAKLTTPAEVRNDVASTRISRTNCGRSELRHSEWPAWARSRHALKPREAHLRALVGARLFGPNVRQFGGQV